MVTWPRIQKLLAEHAAVRQQVADEHMFTVTHENGIRMGTFRLQLFAAPGARPVAVATQTWGECGSLINRAEKYATAVWRRCFLQEPVEPVWMELQLLDLPGRPDRILQQTRAVGLLGDAFTDRLSLTWLIPQTRPTRKSTCCGGCSAATRVSSSPATDTVAAGSVSTGGTGSRPCSRPGSGAPLSSTGDAGGDRNRPSSQHGITAGPAPRRRTERSTRPRSSPAPRAA
jgi:hypothetical protein